jgi:5,6-dimethylbenzimidazole synthase
MPDDTRVSTDSDYDVLHRIMTKRMSARRLKPDPIPDEYIDKILEAGRWAMSGANSQPWEYLVIKDPKKKQELYDAFMDTNMEFCFWMEQMRLFELRHPAFQVEGETLEAAWEKIRSKRESKNRPWHEAPVVIVVLGDGRRQWGTVNAAFTFGRHASHLTDGLANTSTHMQLAIASLGLGSHWGTVHIQEPLKRVLGVPDLIEVYLIISVGYPDMQRKPGVRRELGEIVHYETYDMDKYMSNKDILEYLHQLRGKTMFRYHLKDSLLPEDGEKKG